MRPPASSPKQTPDGCHCVDANQKMAGLKKGNRNPADFFKGLPWGLKSDVEVAGVCVIVHSSGTQGANSHA